MANPDILFRGIPRRPTRGYTAKLLASVTPVQVIIPCTGSFSLAAVAVTAGIAPQRIVCGDISLYSTAIGHAIMDADWRLSLRGSRFDDLLRPHLTTPLDKAAAVLLAVRILQYERADRRAFTLHKQNDLIRNADLYLEQLRQQVAALREGLHGLTYVAQDMWLTMAQYCHGEGVVNLINPPRYSGGYGRMFAGIDAVFDWDEPPARQFTEADYPQLMTVLADQPALSLMYYATQGEDPSPQWGQPWRAVFADRPAALGKAAAINWIIANQDPVGVEASRAKLTSGKAKFKLFADSVTAQSDLRAIKLDKITGDYYRDLLIHRLPGSVTEVYVGLLLEGCLLGVVGLHLADLRRGKTVKKGDKVLEHCASVTFAFTVDHAQYPRLHKLTLMSIVSTWFWEDVLGAESWYALNGAPTHIKTTMLTHHVEVKSARGILKLDTRDPQPDGTYKLTYSAPTIVRDRAATVSDWLRKYSLVQE